MLRNLPFIFVLLICVSQLSAQVGGDKVFKSLDMSPSARVSALGLQLITVGGEDVLLTYENPAVANSDMHKQIAFHHSFYPGMIKQGVVAVGYDAPKLGLTFHGGLKYLNYGDIPETDIYGNKLGSINVGEWALQVGAARALSDKWRMGLNLNFLNGQLDTYSASGLSSDVGFFYQDTSSNLSYALVAKNVGVVLSSFTDASEKLPVNVALAVSKKLSHLPLRVSATMHHLNQWDITYDDPNAKDEIIIIGEESKEGSNFGNQVDNFFRHMIFSGEFLLGKYEQVRIRAGYNHLLNKELSVNKMRGLSGFTFGFGMKIKRFRLDYGYSNYHFGGKVNHLAISSHF